MNDLLDRTSGMSVAERKFGIEKEERMMTATAVLPQHLATATPHRVRPHGLDRLIMRASLATLLWARRHAERTAITRDDQMRMFHQRRARQQREHEAALIFARIR